MKMISLDIVRWPTSLQNVPDDGRRASMKRQFLKLRMYNAFKDAIITETKLSDDGKVLFLKMTPETEEAFRIAVTYWLVDLIPRNQSMPPSEDYTISLTVGDKTYNHAWPYFYYPVDGSYLFFIC